MTLSKEVGLRYNEIHSSFFQIQGGDSYSGITVTIAQLTMARVAQIIFPRNPVATICVVAQHLVTLKLVQCLLP